MPSKTGADDLSTAQQSDLWALLEFVEANQPVRLIDCPANLHYLIEQVSWADLSAFLALPGFQPEALIHGSLGVRPDWRIAWQAIVGTEN